jgi:hypothetical protein
MAAAIVTTATTLEGQALEVIGKLQQLEATYNIANPNTPVNRASISPNIENSEVSLTVTLPTTLAVSGGTYTETVVAYL